MTGPVSTESRKPWLPVQVQLRGTIRKIKEVQQKRGRRLEAEFVDEHGDALPLVWFKGVQWVARNLPVGQPCVLWGRAGDTSGKEHAHPEVLTLQEPARPAPCIPSTVPRSVWGALASTAMALPRPSSA